MRTKDLLIKEYKRLSDLKTDYNIISNALQFCDAWSNKYITVSNQREEIWDAIRATEKRIESLSRTKSKTKCP